MVINILSNRSEWTFYFLSSVQFNFTISDTKKIFKGEQQNQLTPNMLDSILKDVATTPKFRNYSHKEDELNYLIQNALKNNQLNLQLFSIQHQINKNTY